jgi:hypothetical protein
MLGPRGSCNSSNLDGDGELAQVFTREWARSAGGLSDHAYGPTCRDILQTLVFVSDVD